MSSDYRSHHTGTTSAAGGYDKRLFGPGKYEWELWQKEMALLDRVLDLVPRRDRMLDFACGTARVLAHLEDRFREPIGLDISPTMLVAAKPKIQRAELVCGDATEDPDVVEGPFDLVTAFRFFLNAQPDLRDRALQWIVPRLRDENSLLFFNVHGNRWSTRQPVARIKRWQGRIVSWLSPREVRRLVESHGLTIVDWWGIGYWDKLFYKHLPRFVWRGLEGASRILPRHVAVNLYFACRRSS